METGLIVILCTAPDSEVAQTLSRGLVEHRLAACVNVISGVKSTYRWNDGIQVDDEVQLLIKTRPGRFAQVAAWLRANHPYDVPEVVALSAAQVADSYLAWAIEQTT